MTSWQMPEEVKNTNVDFKLLPEGVHIARCIGWVDIGTQSFEYQGEVLTPRKVRLTFETPNEQAVFNEEKGEQPYVISTELTLSFHEKSNLFKILNGWIGLTQENKGKFDPTKDIMGKECMINVKHDISKKGSTFAKIVSITPVPKGTQVPKQINESNYFFMGWSGKASDFDETTFAKLPEFLRNKIANTPEYLDSHAPMPDAEILEILS